MPKMPVNASKINKIKLYCNCHLPDMIDDMILCGKQSGSIKFVLNIIMKLTGNVLIVYKLQFFGYVSLMKHSKNISFVYTLK